jgi:hypothetical protein
LAFLTRNKAKLCKILIITLVSEKNGNFFRRKLSKIAEICDHNIDLESILLISFGRNVFKLEKYISDTGGAAVAQRQSGEYEKINEMRATYLKIFWILL